MQLPKAENSFWRQAYPSKPIYPELTEDLQADVAVVGGGITGLTSAYLLSKAGFRVAVIEKDTIGGGTTGRTTGKITSQHNLTYSSLQEHLGSPKARLYGEANQAALEMVGTIVGREKIDCDWQRDDNYVYTADPRQLEVFKKEAEVAAGLGLPASFEAHTPLPFETAAAVKFANQAKIHSQQYLFGLARAIVKNDGRIFEKSQAISIRDGRPGSVGTHKARVTAKDIVVATSVPSLPLIARGGFCLLEYPMESYIVMGRAGRKLKGMYISPDKTNYSILPIAVDGTDYILIGGESHISGLRGSRQARFRRLADYAATNFGIREILHHWSDRDYLAYDDVPLIGKLYPWSKHLYVATAFRKWGLSNGTAAAMILRDLLTETPNPWAGLFTPQRTGPIKSIPRVIRQKAG